MVNCLPKDFDNYFSDIALVHKYETRVAFLQNNIYPLRQCQIQYYIFERQW